MPAIASRVLRIVVFAAACVAAAWPARASSLPSGASIRIGSAVDVASFARLVAIEYHVALERIVAADIDRDGDLDVVANSDRGLVVWVNDGAGHLRWQTPHRRPAIDGRSSDCSWRDRGVRLGETIQNEAPSPTLVVDRAHGPPVDVDTDVTFAVVPPSSTAAAFRQTPRAPPIA